MGNYEFVLSSIKILAVLIFIAASLAAVVGIGGFAYIIGRTVLSAWRDER